VLEEGDDLGSEGLGVDIRDGQDTGEFRPFDPRVMAIAVRRVIDGFTFRVLAVPDVDAQAFTAEVVALFEHATRDPQRADESARPADPKPATR
jgi:hypothetical protein